MTNTILGLDVGGAHLKAVLINAEGKVLDALQLACPLWRGLDQLAQTLAETERTLISTPQQYAVTMTGELADIFPDRHTGVVQISDLLAQRYENLSFYAGREYFVANHDIHRCSQDIASANWLASASFVASQIKSALFIDLGSTTCDLIPVHNGKAQNLGSSDAERLRYEELVYTGVVRTPVMALAQRVAFAGEWSPLVAEHFATTADIYRLTGELETAYDQADTADGAGRGMEDSARRLARMLGRDLQEATLEQWVSLAYSFRQLQIDTLRQAVMRHYSRGLLESKAPIIGAGAGKFLVRQLARQLACEYMDIDTYIAADTPQLVEAAAVCFPAYAVAQLVRGDA